MSLGDFVRKTREARGLTQHELASLTGIGRDWIGQIELDHIKDASANKLLKLAKGLRVKPDELYAAAGYIQKDSKALPKSVIDAIKELHFIEEKLVAVPVVAELHMPGEILEYIYVNRPRPGVINYVGVRAKGYCLEPQILDGDILIIDKDAQPEQGQTILVYHNGNEHPKLIKYKHVADLKDCEVYGVVVCINRRL